ncbi:MAG: Metallocluster binding protein of the NafY/NifY/NifX/VnfX family [Proteobacteria bacterium]|nr:Metallocluster binding protein of the NafY/NifY/NifX/VnfX family [Pseudomonadota bacterium]
MRPEFPLYLAVASKEGISISQHFGHAKAFRIYEVTPAECRFPENREVVA